MSSFGTEPTCEHDAIERGAKALWNRGRAGFWEEAPESAREHYRIEARAVLDAAALASHPVHHDARQQIRADVCAWIALNETTSVGEDYGHRILECLNESAPVHHDALADDLQGIARVWERFVTNHETIYTRFLKDAVVLDRAAAALRSRATMIVDYRDETISLRAEVVEANRAFRALGAKERPSKAEVMHAINEVWTRDGLWTTNALANAVTALLDAHGAK